MEHLIVNDYEIVEIKTFKEASRYASKVKYLACFNFYDESIFNLYANYETNRIYFCLRKDWLDIKPIYIHSRAAYKDVYQNSAFCVIIDPSGNIVNAALRQLHIVNQWRYRLMTKEDISKILNANYDDVFKPLQEWVDWLNIVTEKMNNNVPFSEIFESYVENETNDIVWHKGLGNYIWKDFNENKYKFRFNQWFRWTRGIVQWYISIPVAYSLNNWANYNEISMGLLMRNTSTYGHPIIPEHIKTDAYYKQSYPNVFGKIVKYDNTKVICQNMPLPRNRYYKQNIERYDRHNNFEKEFLDFYSYYGVSYHVSAKRKIFPDFILYEDDYIKAVRRRRKYKCNIYLKNDDLYCLANRVFEKNIHNITRCGIIGYSFLLCWFNKNYNVKIFSIDQRKLISDTLFEYVAFLPEGVFKVQDRKTHKWNILYNDGTYISPDKWFDEININFFGEVVVKENNEEYKLTDFKNKV